MCTRTAGSGVLQMNLKIQCVEKKTDVSVNSLVLRWFIFYRVVENLVKSLVVCTLYRSVTKCRGGVCCVFVSAKLNIWHKLEGENNDTL